LINALNKEDGMHWLTRYDPDDGEPYGTLCDCEIDENHDGDGELTPS
jgi:hypothetical protein